MFEVAHEEILRCQIVTSSWGGSRYGAFAFTELGVAMLSSVLRTPTAINVNRSIMRAFVEFRHMAATPSFWKNSRISWFFAHLIVSLQHVRMTTVL